ncbi:MAG: hypothetical protein OEY43_09460 [Gammaproteobacteria bacterium]|nr:hypothetical protein [Gammaproteobacteria bacterium]
MNTSINLSTFLNSPNNSAKKTRRYSALLTEDPHFSPALPDEINLKQDPINKSLKQPQ